MKQTTNQYKQLIQIPSNIVFNIPARTNFPKNWERLLRQNTKAEGINSRIETITKPGVSPIPIKAIEHQTAKKMAVSISAIL